MLSKQKKIIGCLIGMLLVIIPVIIILINHNLENKDNPNKDNINSDDGSSEELIFGLPIGIFEATNDRTYNFTLSNTKTGDEFNLTSATFNDIKFNFYQPPSNDAEPAPAKIIKYKDTQVHVEFDGNPSNVLLFGATNENKKKEYIPFEEGRIIYISYKGDDSWAIGGVNTSMTREQVIELWGEPTQTQSLEVGYSMEWHILRDSHTYYLNTIFNSSTNKIEEIILNIDNHAVFK